jgi:AmpD protein
MAGKIFSATELQFKDGLLRQARQLASPNFDQRQKLDDISLIIVHGISLPPNEFGGRHIDELFTNQLNPNAHPYFDKIKDLRVSSHFLIRRDGELVQYVPVHMRAWHAGQSVYMGRERCNDYSIGIELEGADEIPYEEVQYRQLSQLIRALVRDYPGLSLDRVCGHSDVAPGRKTDPGPAFDWQKLRDLIPV